MILEVDAGNTAIKWRIVNSCGDVVVETQRTLMDQLSGVKSDIGGFEIMDARVSCVAGDEVKQALQYWIEHSWGVAPRFAKTHKRFAGLTVSYQDPLRLGVDRWLAMLAAGKECKTNFCIIDCGSAITADRVSAEGKHLGGYIVPGIRLMKRAVLGDTKQIKMAGQQLECQTNWGADTDEAVNYGIFRMAVSFLESIVVELEESSRHWCLYLTGGDAVSIRPMLMLETDIELIWKSDLVFDGLAIALP